MPTFLSFLINNGKMWVHICLSTPLAPSHNFKENYRLKKGS